MIMANNTSNTQRAQEIVVNQYGVYVERIAAVKAETLQAETFKNVKAYQELQAAKVEAAKAVEEYELRAVKENPAYLPLAILTATQACRAYGKKFNVPSMCDETFLNSEAFANMVREHGQYLDTAARIASFVVKVYDSFKTGRTKVVTFKPYTEEEQAALRSFVGKVPGYTPEYVEALIAKGKE